MDPRSAYYDDPDVTHRFAIGASSNLSASRPDHPRNRQTFLEQSFAPAVDWFREMQWTRERPRIDAKLKVQLFISYAPDWILTLLLALLVALPDRFHGFRREFSLTDKSIQHRHTVNDSVPVWLLVVIAFVAPLAIQAIISLGIARSTWDFHVSFLGLVLSHALTATATTLIKVTVGRPRPDLLDRCQPLAGASDPSPWGLVTDAVCTNAVEGHLVTEGFRSFPSGHSSTSFAGLAFLSLYLAGKLYRYGAQAHAAVQWIVYVPIIGATLIAASRTADNRHHATDVVAGGILGSVVAISTYFTYYPSLLHRECHKPYPPRIPRSDGMDESSMLANEEASRASLNASSGDADRSGGPENARVDNTGYMTRLGLDIEAQDTMEGLSAWKASSPA